MSGSTAPLRVDPSAVDNDMEWIDKLDDRRRPVNAIATGICSRSPTLRKKRHHDNHMSSDDPYHKERMEEHGLPRDLSASQRLIVYSASSGTPVNPRRE